MSQVLPELAYSYLNLICLRASVLLPSSWFGNPLSVTVSPHKQSRLAGIFEGILITCSKPQPAAVQTSAIGAFIR